MQAKILKNTIPLQKRGFYILYKQSPKETICIKCKTLFSGKKIDIIQNTVHRVKNSVVDIVIFFSEKVIKFREKHVST